MVFVFESGRYCPLLKASSDHQFSFSFQSSYCQLIILLNYTQWKFQLLKKSKHTNKKTTTTNTTLLEGGLLSYLILFRVCNIVLAKCVGDVIAEVVTKYSMIDVTSKI